MTLTLDTHLKIVCTDTVNPLECEMLVLAWRSLYVAPLSALYRVTRVRSRNALRDVIAASRSGIISIELLVHI